MIRLGGAESIGATAYCCVNGMVSRCDVICDKERYVNGRCGIDLVVSHWLSTAIQPILK